MCPRPAPGFHPGFCCRALTGLSGMNTGTAELIRVSPPEAVVYVKKPEWPVLCTGMNGPRGFGGMCPQFNLAFSLEEAPTFDRGSSLKYTRSFAAF